MKAIVFINLLLIGVTDPNTKNPTKPPMKYLDSCCCGCTLRTGVIILAFLNIAFSIFDLVTSIPYQEVRPGIIYAKITYDVIDIIVSIIGLAGAVQYNKQLIRVLFIWRVIQLIFVIALGIAEATQIHAECKWYYDNRVDHFRDTEDSWISSCEQFAKASAIISVGLLPLLHLYFLWVIKSFEYELSRRGDFMNVVSDNNPPYQNMHQYQPQQYPQQYPQQQYPQGQQPLYQPQPTIAQLPTQS